MYTQKSKSHDEYGANADDYTDRTDKADRDGNAVGRTRWRADELAQQCDATLRRWGVDAFVR
jgi:hypothetical protein